MYTKLLKKTTCLLVCSAELVVVLGYITECFDLMNASRKLTVGAV